MNIAIVTPYGNAYDRDRLFDLDACKIGENLLLPGIMLRRKLEELGHNYHTADMYDFPDIDVLVFQDLNHNSKLLLSSPVDVLKYVIKKKWKNDYLYKCVKGTKPVRKILLMQEPPVIFPQSCDLRYHRYFDRVLTWNSELVDGQKYFQFFYPQVMPLSRTECPYEKKKYLTMICGNKSSNHPDELYSKRKAVIEFYDSTNGDLDLYGFGWDRDKIKSYRGSIDKKIATLSQYKFSICFENMCHVNGYITEKIFDCFFAGCVPVYWGAENIAEYVPENTFIDYRKFESIRQMDSYLKNMSHEVYFQYITAINDYLDSPEFTQRFGVDSYVERLLQVILE